MLWKGLALAGAVILWINTAFAQPEPMMVRSRTDQFTVFGLPQANSSRANSLMGMAQTEGGGYQFWLRPNSIGAITNSSVYLEPGLVAVSCERIKEALLRELKAADTRDRRIYIQINNRLQQHQTRIVADRYERGWMYGVELPSKLDEHFYSATILQVLLYEMANRHSPEHQVDPPEWLISGMVSYLQGTTLQSLSIQPNAAITRVQVKMDSLSKARQTFEQDLPLTFEELSWPDDLSKERAALFRDSAHLFVHELLHLKEGRESMRQFIQDLSKHRNWQFALLRAYPKYFNELADIEKWWALNFVNFMGRDASQLWTLEESWKQLKTALDVTMHVQLDADRLPVTADYNLQEVISKWDNARQDMILNKALTQLRILRLRTHPDLRHLVDDYRKVIERYLEQKMKAGRPAQKGEQAINSNILKRNTCRQLDQLDEERSKLFKTLPSRISSAR